MIRKLFNQWSLFAETVSVCCMLLTNFCGNYVLTYVVDLFAVELHDAFESDAYFFLVFEM